MGPKTMQLLKAMRGQLGDTSASRSVDAVAAAEAAKVYGGRRLVTKLPTARLLLRITRFTVTGARVLDLALVPETPKTL